MKWLGKLIAAPIRLLNVPVKAAKACLDASMAEPIRYEKNALDDIADIVEKSVDEATK